MCKVGGIHGVLGLIQINTCREVSLQVSYLDDDVLRCLLWILSSFYGKTWTFSYLHEMYRHEFTLQRILIQLLEEPEVLYRYCLYLHIKHVCYRNIVIKSLLHHSWSHLLPLFLFGVVLLLWIFSWWCWDPRKVNEPFIWFSYTGSHRVGTRKVILRE